MGTRTRTRTIGAVLALMGGVVHPCGICPNKECSEAFKQEYRRRINELFVAFYKETGVDLTATVTMPLDMPMGKRSCKIYWRLKTWLAEQMPPGSEERRYFTKVDIQELPKN